MRYFFGFLAAVALVILVFILVIRGFRGNHQPPATELVSYAPTQTVMRMIQQGPVKADQTHYVSQITVGRDGNTMNIIQGYEGHVINTKSYASNQPAYATFLRALDLQGYTKGNDDPSLEDSRGYCPRGSVYTFEIVTGNSTVQKFWTTSCGGGSFKGKSAVIRALFRAQIPDYSQLIRGTGLN